MKKVSCYIEKLLKKGGIIMRRKLSKALAIMLSASTMLVGMPALAVDENTSDETVTAVNGDEEVGDEAVPEVGDENTGGDDAAEAGDENTDGDDAAAEAGDENTDGDDAAEVGDENTDADEGDTPNGGEDLTANDGYYNIISGQYTGYYYDGEKRTYYYSDDYFNDKGSEKNAHLRTMSGVVAITAIKDSKEYTEDIFDQTGFSEIETYGGEKGSIIGATFAHKKLADGEIVAVAIGYGESGAGWATNFNVGATGDHAGFSKAAKEIQGYLDTYLSDKGVTAKKIWVMGYSQGGAVADLFGKYLNNSAASLNISQDDIYVYTFEAPGSTTDDVVFNNIHNCVDENDFITYIVPSEWGFSNCGVKEVINTGNKKLKKKQADFGNITLNKKPYTMNDGVTTYASFINGFVSWFSSDGNVSRDVYAEELQEHAVVLAELFGSKTDDELKAYSNYFEKDFADALKGVKDKNKLITMLLNAISGEKDREKAAMDDFEELLFSILEEDAAKKVFTEDEIKKLESAVSGAKETLFYLLLDDFIVSEDRGSDSSFYEKTEKNHKADETDNKKDGLSEADEKDWYVGYDVGYDAGFEAGEARDEYDSTPQDLPKNAGSAAKSGYIYGYYEGYLFAVDYGEMTHVLQKTMTVIDNAEKLVNIHKPDYAITVLEAQDSYYTNPPVIGVSGSENAAVTGSAIAGGNGNIVLVLMIIFAMVVVVEATVIIRSRKKE